MFNIDRPRRIVTGLRDDGTSYFARVEEVEEDFRSASTAPQHKSWRVYRMWANDFLPVQLPTDGLSAPIESQPTADETPEALRMSPAHPGEHGLRVSLCEILPYVETPSDPRMRWFDTFDILWLIAGELTAIMDDGSEVVMRPGDVILQNGTNHDWRAGNEGAVMGLVMLGARREGPSPPPEFKGRLPQPSG